MWGSGTVHWNCSLVTGKQSVPDARPGDFWLAQVQSVGWCRWWNLRRCSNRSPDAQPAIFVKYDYDSQGLHCVKQTSEKIKVRRLVKYKFKIPHQRSPYAVKFEDRTPGETARHVRCARGKAWNLARHIYKLKEKDKVTFYSPTEKWILPAASKIKTEERESLW